MTREHCFDNASPEIDVARIASFDSFRAYRWLVKIAEPNPKLYGYLRDSDVDLNHVINLLDGAIALCEWRIGSGPKENCIFLPLMDEDAITPLDIVAFSMRDPSRFQTVLGIGAVLGAGELLNPASYWAGGMCHLVRTPLQWMAAGIEFHACVLDAKRAKPLFDWCPGNIAAMDLDHAEELLAAGVIDEKRLFIPNPKAAAA
jgi:hypothetical protein